MTSVHDFTVNDIKGEPRSLADYRGKVLLVVNVASKCGFTPQYTALEEMYRKHRDEGFEILGFPCNQFRNQEPGSDAEIATFCTRDYGVSFPLFAKIDVNGRSAAPLYKFLKHAKPGFLGTEAIKWNFTKFLVDRDGAPVARFGTNETPEAFAGEVARLVARPAR